MGVEGQAMDTKAAYNKVLQAFDPKQAGRAGVSFGLAETEAKKALRKVRPARTRKATIEAIAKEAAKSDPLMAWFSEIVDEDGRVTYETVGDIFGEAIWNWKEGWEISENDMEFDELSRDSHFAKLITDYAKKWKASSGGIKSMPRDYAAASSQVSRHRGLAELLKGLASGRSRNEEADRKEALGMLPIIHKILK
jgi:hypothetical protein